MEMRKYIMKMEEKKKTPQRDREGKLWQTARGRGQKQCVLL